MLKIIANNQELDLGSLKGISLNINPGLFDNDSTDGTLIIPFTLDESEINNIAFNFPYKMSNANKEIREVAGELWHSGIKLREGTIKAAKFPHGKISCNFYIDNGNLYKDFNEKLLNENDFGGYKAWVSKSEYDYTSDDFVLYSVKNDSYFKGTIDEGAIGDYDNFQNYYSGGTFRMEAGYPSIVTPFPLLWQTLISLFINKGFRYLDSFFSQGDYRTINIFNTVSAVEPEIYTSNNQTFTRNILTRYDIANHLPQIPTGEFINAIQTFFNIKFYVLDYEVQVIDRLQLISNPSYDDVNNKVVGKYTKELTGLNITGVALTLQKDGNDENVQNVPELPDGYVQQTDIAPYSPGEALEKYPYALAFYRSVNNTGKYYQYFNFKDIEPDTTEDFWEWYDALFYGVDIRIFNEQTGLYLGNREFGINANLSSVPNEIIGFKTAVSTHLMPKVLQKGNSYQHSLFNPFTLRLMMYNGVQSDVEGTTMPLGSVERNGISITATWSYFERWKEYLEWWNDAQKEKYNQQLDLSASELKNFDFTKKKLINNNLFFITKMKVQLLRKSISLADCEMIKAT